MKTPMQELLQDIKDGGDAIYMIERFYIEQEKQQIIDAWENGYNHGACVSEDKDKYHGNQYYKETFK